RSTSSKKPRGSTPSSIAPTCSSGTSTAMAGGRTRPSTSSPKPSNATQIAVKHYASFALSKPAVDAADFSRYHKYMPANHGIAMKTADKCWMDGKIVPWEQAHVPILTHTLHYGLGAFEAIRSYKRADGKAAIFRLREHIDRLFDSCHICTIEVPFSKEQMMEACKDILRANKIENAYLGPIVFIGDPHMGL